jgi:hypothetical protein
MDPPDRAGVLGCDAPKTFNNPVGFEWALWQHKNGAGGYYYKRPVLGRSLGGSSPFAVNRLRRMDHVKITSMIDA